MSMVHHTVTQKLRGCNCSHSVECRMTAQSPALQNPAWWWTSQHSWGRGRRSRNSRSSSGGQSQPGCVRACLKTTNTKALQGELKLLSSTERPWTLSSSVSVVHILSLQVCAATPRCYGFTGFVSCRMEDTIFGIFINSEATQNDNEACTGVLGSAQISKPQQVVSLPDHYLEFGF